MKCSNKECGRRWHVPSQGGVIYAGGKDNPVCSMKCAEAVHKENREKRG